MRLAPAALAVAIAFALASAASADTPLVRKGRALYVAGCISCHGDRGQGVPPVGTNRGAGGIRGAGPPLRGVGAASADFYLRTGYMPLRNPFDQPARSAPSYSRAEIDALVAYIASLGGPPIPKVDPSRGSLSEGLQLFTENCSGCHQIVAEGGVVTDAVAPALKAATPTQIAEAVRIGPFVMPRFTPAQLDDRQLESIIRYVLYARDPDDRGGWDLGHVGPIPEGMVAWLLAGGVLVLLAALIGGRREQ
jgi:ubiquinol-cytochrome c reductase cytochrome c subunit